MPASPTELCLDVDLDRAALRGNLFPRVTETSFGVWEETVRRIEMLGVTEVQKYLRICEAERVVMHRIASGERIHGHKKISMIARLASTPTLRVSREDVLEVLK